MLNPSDPLRPGHISGAGTPLKSATAPRAPYPGPVVSAPGSYWLGITLLGLILMIKVSQGPEANSVTAPAPPPAHSPEAMAPAPRPSAAGEVPGPRTPGAMAFFLPGVLV